MGNQVIACRDLNSEHEWARLARRRTEFADTGRALPHYLPPPLTQQRHDVTLAGFLRQLLGPVRLYPVVTDQPGTT